jgi:hypothetical protein
MKIILIVFVNKDGICCHIVSDYNYKYNDQFKLLIKESVLSANLSKNKFKRFVMVGVDNNESFIKKKHKSYNLKKNVEVMSVHEYRYLSDFSLNMKVIEEYVLNKKDIKFIKLIMDVNKTLHTDAVICYDSDSDTYKKDIGNNLIVNRIVEPNTNHLKRKNVERVNESKNNENTLIMSNSKQLIMTNKQNQLVNEMCNSNPVSIGSSRVSLKENMKNE